MPFLQLTRPGIDLGNGQQAFYDNPGERAVALARAVTASTQPMDANLPDAIPPVPMDTGAAIPDLQPDTTFAPDASAPQPRAVNPSFQSETTDPYGNTRPGAVMNPRLTKLGKLFAVLHAAAQGGIDAASSGALDAAPGKSYFGAGLQGAQEMPLIRIARAQQQQKAALENAQLQSEMQPISTPLGPMPLWKARQVAALQKDIAEGRKANLVTPRSGGVFNAETGEMVPGTMPAGKAPTKLGDYVGSDGKQHVITQSPDGTTQDQVFGDTQPKSSQDAKVGERVGPDNNKYVMYKKPDGTTYEVKVGAERETQANKSQEIPDIKPNTPQFKVAQDLAYGRLTMQQFRSLTAYSRDTGLKMAVYQKAGELNPNFNPAAFEAGYKLASNPRVQQQLASLDNVVQAAPDLIEASDQATRYGIKAVNKIVNWGGAEFGGHKYSNFHTAQIAFADELSGALGYGSATDMSRDMGFNMTDPNLSPGQFADGIRNVVLPFVVRKRSTLLNQMGIYGQGNNNPAANAPKTVEEVKKTTPPKADKYPGVRFTPIQ